VRAADYIKQHGAHIPRAHLADDLRERFPKLTDDEVAELVEAA
jgi:hypothetical protein